MGLFWERIMTKVREKTGITETQYSKALEEQENTIVELLSFHCYPETEIEAEIANTKKEILTLYTKVIAPAISKIEVYSHDLDAHAVESIFFLLQQIASAELTSDIIEKETFYKETLSYAYFIKHSVQKTLSELYFERIRTYKRTIRDFNYRGVYIGQDSFIKVVAERTKKAKKQYRESRNLYRSYINKDSESIACLRLKNVESDIGFDGLVSQLEEIVGLYISKFPEIINNGYNMSFLYRLTSNSLEIVSGLLLVYGFLRYTNLWQYVVSWFCNFIYAYRHKTADYNIL